MQSGNFSAWNICAFDAVAIGVTFVVNSVFKKICAAICGYGGMKYASAHEYYMNEWQILDQYASYTEWH